MSNRTIRRPAGGDGGSYANAMNAGPAEPRFYMTATPHIRMRPEPTNPSAATNDGVAGVTKMNALTHDHRSAGRCVGSRAALVISQTPDGLWSVCDRRKGFERSFATQRAALHFALFERVGSLGAGAALVIPPTGLMVRRGA